MGCRSILVSLLAGALFAGSGLAVPTATLAQSGENLCAVGDDTAFESALSEVTTAAVESSHDAFDYRAAVDDGWRLVGVEGILAAEAKRAGDDLRRDWGPWSTYLTGWGIGSTEAAEEIANRVFGGDAFDAAVREVAEFAIGRLAEEFAADGERLVDPVQSCVTGYLDANYPAIIRASAQTNIAAGELGAPVGPIDGPNSVVDFAVIVAGITLAVSGRVIGRITARVAGNVARRVVGKLLSRAIPVVGWLLLAYEALFAQAGAVPAIVAAVQDERVVDGLQAEIALELRAGVAGSLVEISDGIVGSTLAGWRRFRADHDTLLGLIEAEPGVRAFMETFDAGDDLTSVNRALVRVIEIGGEDTLLHLVAGGRIGETLDLSDEGFRVARDLDDVEAALDWELAAGPRLAEVLRTDLHRLREPGDLSPDALSFLLDLAERPTIARVAAMDPDLIETLPRYGASRVTMAARALNAAQSTRYFAALADIDDLQARNVVWDQLASADAGSVDAFVGNVEAVAASRDPAAAADIVFAGTLALLQPTRIADAVAAALRGDVSWAVLGQRYWLIAIVALGLIVVVFAPVLRLFFPQRTRVVIRHER